MLRAVASFWKMIRPWDAESVPRVPKARGGESTRVGFPLSKDLAREKFRFRKAVYAFYYILSAISVYELSQFCRYVGRNIPDNCYVWASNNTNILNTTISTNHRITMAPGRVVFLKATLASFQLENPLSKNALSRFELFNFPFL